MKPLIKNPVFPSPWATDEKPNNFRGSRFGSNKASGFPKPAEVSASKSKRSRSSINRTKLQTTNNYTEQLAPLYPFLSKTQVRAGVVLANNNLHKSRLLLDLTNKFLTVTPLNLAMYFHQRRKEDPVIYMDKSSSTDDSFSTVTMFSSSEESWKENIPPNEGGGKGEEANSNVFEFTDSETKILSWSSHKRLCAKKKKVGVSIIKCQQGYKAFLL